MANFRSTADYVDTILLLSGETTNGNSAFESRALHYLNRIHNSVIVGGNEFNMEVDEVWPWSMSRSPMILELEPKVTGSASVTNGLIDITFSETVAGSKRGWHIKFDDDPHFYKIIYHIGSTASAKLDGNFLGSTSSSVGFELYKLDYELVPKYLAFETENQLLTFTETTAGTELNLTGLNSVYEIDDLKIALENQFNGPGAADYDVAYDEDTRLFTITSDGGGGVDLFSMLGATASNANTIRRSILPTLGFGLKDYTGALSYTAERALGAICKLISPFKLHNERSSEHEVMGLNPITFQDKYPINQTREGDPDFFTIVEERDDGYIRVRFNKFVNEAKRIYVNYVPLPLDLYDNANSHPLVPRKYSQVLEYGAASYLLAEKNDNRAQQYFQIAGNVLESMIKNNRRESQRIDRNFGNAIARQDLRPGSKRRLRYGYTSEDY